MSQILGNSTPDSPPEPETNLGDRAPSWRPLGPVEITALTRLGMTISILSLLHQGLQSGWLLIWLPNGLLDWLPIELPSWGGWLGLPLVIGWQIQAPALQKQVGSWNLRVLEIFTLWTLALGIEWLLTQGSQFMIDGFNQGLGGLPWINPVSDTWTQPLLAGLQTLALLCFPLFPWLLDVVLQVWYNLEPLEPKTLRQYSPETARLLRHFFCQQQGVPFPQLGLLPTPIPVIFSYGHLPRTARIVVSQGLLEQFTAAEIATLYGAETGHFQNRSSWILPWLLLLLQLPYGLYWHFAIWGDQCQAQIRLRVRRSPRSPKPSPALSAIPRWWGPKIFWQWGLGASAWLAAASYGCFKLCRWPLLALGRQRSYYSDRASANLTGNPNGHARSLVKLAILMAATIEAQGSTPALLEGFELLLPLGPYGAVSLSQGLRPEPTGDNLNLEALNLDTLPIENFHWDCLNPYRHWLSLNNAHPPTGDRLRALGQYAQHWRLTPSFNLPTPDPQARLLPGWKRLSPQSNQAWQKAFPQIRLQLRRSAILWVPLLAQGLVFWGLGLGLLAGLFLWFFSALANLLGLWPLTWIFGNVPILRGCIPLGLGLCLIIRHNLFFPYLSPRLVLKSADPLPLLQNTTKLPYQAQAIRWQGQLRGRTGVSNWLGQDLWLQTPTGLIKIHHCSFWGPMGGLWRPKHRLVHWVNQPITLKGWLRRGATLWIDGEQIQRDRQPPIQGGHPIWLLILAGGAMVWGLRIVS